MERRTWSYDAPEKLVPVRNRLRNAVVGVLFRFLRVMWLKSSYTRRDMSDVK